MSDAHRHHDAYDVAVLGAGPAGLLAAWRAAQQGQRVLVLERAAHVGGMAASIEVAGQRVDLGSHRLHPSTSPRVLDALRDLLGDDLCERTRNGRIALGGTFVAFPLQLPDLLKNLPIPMAAAMARDAATAPLRRPRDDSFAESIRVGLGPTVLGSFYGPFARKLWDTDAADLSGQLAQRRVSAGSPVDIVRRLVSKEGKSKRSFLYPRRGFGQIAEALAAAAEQAGATIELQANVERIAIDRGGVRLCIGHAAEGAERGLPLEVRAPVLLSTIPITALATMLDLDGAGPAQPPPPLAALRYRGMRLVYLGLDQTQYTPFDAHYLPSPDTVASRLSEPKNYRDGDDPPDRTVLCAEVPSTPGDSIWRRPAAALAEQLAVELETLGLPRVRVSSVTTVELPRVYPVYEKGFERHLQAVEDWLEHIAPVVSFGRAGLFTPDNTHHALEMGWEAADCLRPGGGFDRERWRASRESFRGHVVED